MQLSSQPHAAFFESNDAIPSHFSRMLRRLTAVSERRRQRHKLRIWLVERVKISVLHVRHALKPGFHMSGKSQTVWDFTVSRPSQILPIYRIFARGLSQTFPIMNLAGLGKRARLRNLNINVTASLCCVVHNTSVLLHWSMQGFTFWKKKKTEAN